MFDNSFRLGHSLGKDHIHTLTDPCAVEEKWTKENISSSEHAPGVVEENRTEENISSSENAPSVVEEKRTEENISSSENAPAVVEQKRSVKVCIVVGPTVHKI
jgi:hypothetical protein